jgi:hypothetical protein
MRKQNSRFRAEEGQRTRRGPVSGAGGRCEDDCFGLCEESIWCDSFSHATCVTLTDAVFNPLPRERRTGEPNRANDQQRVTLLPRQVLSNVSHLVDREKELQDRVLCVGWWGVSVRMLCVCCSL